MASISAEDLQTSFNKLADWAEENKICINAEKTVSMTFRRGGKHTIFYHRENPIDVVTHVKYLGIILQTSGDKFAMHVKDRVSAANRSMNSIKLLRKLSLKTAVKLFNVKVPPDATYGIETIWPFLTKDQLANLEKIKASFLKRPYVSPNTLPQDWFMCWLGNSSSYRK